jgi:hypothetical protein
MSDETPAGPTKEQLKGAMKAFKKRLKLTRLDAESKLTRNPATTGRGSGIVAINPPDQFPPAVWEELVRQGKLKRTREGLFEMVEQSD